MTKETMEQRFWKKVEKSDGCWAWLGGRVAGTDTTKPYGVIFSHRDAERRIVLVYAHRYSWGLRFGAVPNDMDVLHECDNPLCVNPEHLFLGTAHDNAMDMVRKGRHRGGPNSPAVARKDATQ
jgi:hypothetical protein